jgi:hypothetical protein
MERRQRLTLFSRPDFRGQSVTVTNSVTDMRRVGFMDRTGSAQAQGRWQVCSRTHFRGHCQTVRGSERRLWMSTGRVASARRM